LLTRLERLESRVAAQPPLKSRMGHLKRLPAEYVGERHTVVARQLPNRGGQEWVEFEERPGPDPNPVVRNPGEPMGLDIIFVSPYPRVEE
jgi:hypothetical protein